jgi:anaerobic ribonucleoside-triphosphate reductase
MIDIKSHKQTSPMSRAVIDSKGCVLLEESERTRTEVWTRVMGYHRPVSAFNPGKQSEHAERLHFRL